MSRGQVAIEFLVVFALSLAVVSLLVGAVLLHSAKIRMKTDDLQRISQTEAAVRAIEVWLNSGIAMKFDFSEENVSYRVEQGRFRVEHEGKIIEIGGVFIENYTEPI